jgi:hypothetical protein
MRNIFIISIFFVLSGYTKSQNPTNTIDKTACSILSAFSFKNLKYSKSNTLIKQNVKQKNDKSSIIQSNQTQESGTCQDAFDKTMDQKCLPTKHTILKGQTQYWLKFNATSSKIQFKTDLDGVAPIFSSIKLVSGNCNSNLTQEVDSNYTVGTTKEFTSSLIIGQTYFIVLDIESDYDAKFSSCITKSTHSGPLIIVNQDGDTTFCNFNTDPTLGNFNFLSCPSLTVCGGDTLCFSAIDTGNIPEIIMSMAIDSVYGQIGQITYNSDSTEACVVFPYSGLQTIIVWPYSLMEGQNPANHPNWPFNNLPSTNGEIHGDIDHYLEVLVVDSIPPGVSNNNSDILCLSSTYNLTAYAGSIISNVTVNGTNVFTPNASTWTYNFTTPGQYIIEYTETGFCNPSTYFDTIQVFDSTYFTVTISNCNLATFTFSTCDNFTSILLNYGDGNIDNLSNFTGTVTWTHDYSGITLPVNWSFIGYGLLFPSPPTIGVLFNQTGTIQPQVPQSLTLSGPQYLCEMNPNSITINSPSNLQNISWSTSSPHIFLGQGTTQITPISWSQYQNDISVMVTANDSNGCLYSGQTTLFACCLADTSGTEFFERTYTQPGQNSMSAQLPIGYYNGPSQQISINLPTPQLTNNQISTIYSTATSVTQFIAQNPSIYDPSLATISTPNWIFFNNDFIIDQSVTFDLCHFMRFAPGAKIIVQSNKTLRITRSTLAPKCNEMWGGIEMNNNTESVLLRDVSIIGAKTGLLSSNGGYYQITSSNFIDNLVGIKVENYTTILTTSSIVGSYFGDVIGQPLLPPYQTEPQPLIGISIEDIKEITIGAPNNLVEGNLFHHHQRGIQSIRSNVKSFRNNFFNIKHAGSGPLINQGDKYAAIFANNTISFSGGLANHTLWVGGTTDLRNNFLNCEFGISSRKNMNLDARNNYMKNCLLRGISAEDNPFKKIDVLTNEINSISSNAWAIYVKNYSYGTATVSYNKINTSSTNLPMFTRFSAGIYISSVNPTVSQTTTVYSNTINNCLYGIWMINTTNGLLESNTININLTNFMINSLSNNFAPIRGIVVQNSNKARIRRNIITRNYGNGIGVINNNLQGIRLELSPASEVWENRMYNTAVGFYAFGSSLGSRVDCNQMHYTRNGFYLQLADLSDQGAPAVTPYPNGYDAHNQWYNTFSSRTDGTMPNGVIRKYFHGGNPALFSTPNNPIIPQWVDILLLTQNPETTCIQAKNPLVNIETPVSKRERELLPIAQNNIQYDTLDYQQKHFLNLAAFSRLESDSSLLIMNIPEDSIFVYYVEQNINLNSQSKIINDAQKSMATFNFLVSQNACSQISTNCTLYNTNKMVQELWIQRKMDDTEFTSADTLFLMNIACLDPLEFGSGVYQARAMIDWDGLCNCQSKSVNLGNSEHNKIAQFSKVYPNPSDGKFQLEADSPIKKVILFDLNGIELRNFTNIISSEIETKLSTGVYLVQIILENGITETHKIYIR